MTPIERVSDPDAVAACIQARALRLGQPVAPDSPQTGVVFEDEYLRVERDPVRFPNGAYGTYLRVGEAAASGGIAGVVCLPSLSGRYLLQRVYRYPLQAWVWELPRGMIVQGKTPEESARLELMEETGFAATQCVSLGQVAPNSGILQDKAEVFYMKCDPGTYGQATETHEALDDAKWVTLQAVMKMIQMGDISDGYTLSAFCLLLAQNDLPEPFQSSLNGPTLAGHD